MNDNQARSVAGSSGNFHNRSECPDAIGLVCALPPGASITECSITLSGEAVTQLDDVLIFERDLVDGSTVEMCGMVSEMIAVDGGAEYETDVFHIRDALVPSATSETARLTSRDSRRRYSCHH